MGPTGFGPCFGFGIVGEDGWPLGGAVYHNYHPEYRSIEISFATATKRCLTRQIIREILSDPFARLDCQRVTAVTPRLARPAREFLERIGFKREGLIRKGFGTDHAVVYGLLKSEWLSSKWMKDRALGQVRTDPASAA